MFDSTEVNRLFGAKAVDREGAKLGTVKQVYVDADGGRPMFASIATGLFGTSESFVPLRGGTFDGEVLRVAHDKSTVKDAPRIDAEGVLSDEEQASIWDYYGPGDDEAEDRRRDATDRRGDATDRRRDDVHERTDRAEARREEAHERGTMAERERGAAAERERGAAAEHERGGDRPHDTREKADAERTTNRSEERLDVAEKRAPEGRVRLRRHVVTEQQSTGAPVRREEVLLERETNASEDAEAALRELADAEQGVTEERVVVQRETVVEDEPVTGGGREAGADRGIGGAGTDRDDRERGDGRPRHRE